MYALSTNHVTIDLFCFRALITTDGLDAGRITRIPPESDIIVFRENCCAEQVMLCEKYTSKRPIVGPAPIDGGGGTGGKAFMVMLEFLLLLIPACTSAPMQGQILGSLFGAWGCRAAYCNIFI